MSHEQFDLPTRSEAVSAPEMATVIDMPSPPSEVQKPKPSAKESLPSVESGVFGSFWIDNTELALPVDVIQEVVNEPETYAQVPLSPPHVVGVFSLRKMIIPVIDLRLMLGFPEAPANGRRKVAIIENGDLCIGLLFDDTGGVIKSAGAARVMFQPNSEGEKDVIVQGILKLDNGKRMVQLLDPFEILKIKRVPRVAKSEVENASNQNLGTRLNCISFQLGHTNCAIDLRFVQEITKVPEIQKSQVAHGHILGNIELRGRTMPVIDFRGMIGNEPPHKFNPDALKNRKLLILSLEEGDVGLLVYSIDSIMTFYENDVLPFANVALPRHDIVSGCLVSAADEIVILLDHTRLLRDSLLVEAATSCKEIYPSKPQEIKGKNDAAHAVRATYILFTVHMPMAFDISCVSEIINRPEKLLKPPYALKFVDGILNLRGDLITLINPRVLYGLPESEVPGNKVLIFQKDKKKYGIVVDSVDEIVTTTTRELLDVPSIITSDINRAVSQDVSGCLMVPTRSRESDPVLVLNEASLIARCAETETL